MMSPLVSRVLRTFIISAFIAMLPVGMAMAGKRGAEVRINQTTVQQQMQSAVSRYGGGFVVTWQSGIHPGGDYDVYARLYSAAGVPRGNQFRVNQFRVDHQSNPTIDRLSNGGFVICWQSFGNDTSGYGIYCQIYDRDGVKVGANFRASRYRLMNQQEPAVAGMKNGRFVVVWKDEGRGGRIVGHVYSNAGARIGGEFFADTNNGFLKAFPHIASLSGGGFVVVWQSFAQEGASMGWGIYGRRYSATGQRLGGEFHVNTITDNEQTSPVVAGQDGGGYVVAWKGRDAFGDGIKAQMFSAAGSKVGTEFLVNTSEQSHQVQPAIAPLSNGGFVILWHAWQGVGPAFDDVNGQAYNASGAPIGVEFLVNRHSPLADTGVQDAPAVSRLGAGFIATWTSTLQDGDMEGVYGQRFSAP